MRDSVRSAVIEERVPLALGCGVCESRRFSQPSFVVWFSCELECNAETYRERTPLLPLVEECRQQVRCSLSILRRANEHAERSTSELVSWSTGRGSCNGQVALCLQCPASGNSSSVRQVVGGQDFLPCQTRVPLLQHSHEEEKASTSHSKHVNSASRGSDADISCNLLVIEFSKRKASLIICRTRAAAHKRDLT